MGILGKAGLAGVVMLGCALSGGASAVEYSGVDLADKQLCLVAAKGTYKGSSSFIWDPKFKAYRNEAVKRGLTPEKCGLYFPVVQGTEASTPAPVAKVVQSAPMTECDRLAASPSDPMKLGAGVEGDKVKGLLAIKACEAAVKAYPDEERLWFQMGRAFHINDYYIQSIPWYRKAAERGYSAAQNNLGLMYDGDRGVTRDYKEAVKWYRKAAKQGYAEAQNNLGGMYYYGKSISKNFKEAVRWYRKAAEQGHARAQYSLGWAYKNGEGVTKDPKEAVKWYRKAAEQGHAGAQNNLGIMYNNGQGVTRDYKEAVKWYRKAAEQGSARAQNNLGTMLKEGIGVTKDPEEAVKRYRQAAEQGDATGQYNLAGMYRYLNGVARDPKEAVKWYRKAAEQGHASAQHNLARMYESGYGITRDHKEAVKWYRKAAEQDNVWAIARLKDLTKLLSDKKAYRTTLKQAESDDAEAQNKLGDMYEDGTGVKKNPRLAIKWFTKAATQGLASAQRSLGVMYGKGLGVIQDEVVALKWLYLSSAQGEGASDRDKQVNKMTPGQIAQARRLAKAWKPGRVFRIPCHWHSLNIQHVV
jgi:TPR repeat protein